jgi:hypothetical protein
VVARTAGNSITHWWTWDGKSWAGEENLGRVTESDPGISSRANGRLEIFHRGTNNALFQKNYYNASWSGWSQIGGPMVGGPDAVAWGFQQIQVVGMNYDVGNSMGDWYYGP